MKTLALAFTTLLFCLQLSAQTELDLSVPQEILDELKTETIDMGAGTFTFKVRYPDNYNPTKSYPVYLCFGGGNQNENIVNYCYAAWFRSPQVSNYITILPVAEKGHSLSQYEVRDFNLMLVAIRANYNATGSGWLIGGTSNGGIAAFNLLAVAPELFSGALLMPGSVNDEIETGDAWKHLKFLLVYGKQDDKDWIDAAAAAEKKLAPFVSIIKTMPLKGQGHILPIEYDMEPVYTRFFSLTPPR